MSCRVLFISGSFGLGHVTRDLAIAKEMGRMCPQVEIFWLAGSPACEVLAAAGEKLAPELDKYLGDFGACRFSRPQRPSQPHCLCVSSDANLVP